MPAGRPLKAINWAEVEKLCALQCTEEEIASFLGISVDTLYRACKREHRLNFAEYFKQKKGLGKISLRRSQWLLAQKGNVTMQIWLGKQYLDQRDKTENKTDLKADIASSEEVQVVLTLPSNGREAKIEESN